MWYAIVGEDTPNSLEKRLAVRPAHIARLTALQNAGKLFVAGAFPNIDSETPGNAGFSGSLIVAEFESLEAAQTWASADPYLQAGIYARVTVKPFRKALP